MPTPRILTAGLLVALASPLAAQRPAPSTVIPEDPLVSLHIDGPAALRAAFLPTNLGKMFGGAEFQEMTAPFLQMWESLKEQGEMPFDAAALEKAVVNYRGRLSAGLHLFDETIDFTAPEPPDFFVTISLSPDGKTDLAALCKQVAKMATADDPDLITARSGEHTIQYSDTDGTHVSVPFLHKNHAVMLISSNMEMAADRIFAKDMKPHVPDPEFASASIGASLNAALGVKLLASAAQQDPDWESTTQHIFKRSGLRSLRSVDLTYRAHGPALLSELVVNFNQNDRGFLGIFMPAQARRSQLIDALPRDAAMATAFPLDIKKAYDVVKAVFTDIGDEAPMPFEDLLAEFKDYFGLRLKEDVVDTFGRGMLALSMETDDDPNPNNPLSTIDGLTVGLGLANGKLLEKSIDTILRREGLHAGRIRTEYTGTNIYGLTVLGVVEMQYAVTDDLLLFGAGAAGQDSIRAVLDTRKAHAAADTPTPLPKKVQRRTGMVKGGYHGVGWSDIALSIENLVARAGMLAGGAPEAVDHALTMMRRMPALMKKYDVEHQVTVIRSTGTAWVYQNIW